MVPQVAAGEDGLVLRQSPHRQEFRQDRRDEARIQRQDHGAIPARVDQHPPEFLGDPFGRHLDDLGRHRLQGPMRLRLDRQPEPRGEPDGPEEPELVLGEPLLGHSDGPEDPGLQVRPAAHEIEDVARDRVEEHPVDGEIPTRRVLLGRAEAHLHRPAAVEVLPVGAEGGHLDLARLLGAKDADHAETHAHGDGPAEEAEHLLGSGRGRDVIIRRREAEDQVADAPAGPQGLVPGPSQMLDDLDGEAATRVGLDGKFHRVVAPCSNSGGGVASTSRTATWVPP